MKGANRYRSHLRLVEVLLEAGHIHGELESNLFQDLQSSRRLGGEYDLPRNCTHRREAYFELR